MRKRIKIILLIILIVIILTGLWYLVWGRKNNNQTTQARLESDKIISKINSDIFNNSLKKEEGVSSWIMNNDQRICLSNGVRILDDNINSEEIYEINKKLSDWFINLGFVKNVKNSYEVKDEFRDSTIGFEKGNMKCVIDWHIDSKFQMISCAKLTEQDIKNHEKFYNLVNDNKTNDSSLVCVRKQNNEFAVGTINFWRTGAEWYAKKESGVWSLMIKTQDFLKCSLANQLPEGFYEHEICYPDE